MDAGKRLPQPGRGVQTAMSDNHEGSLPPTRPRLVGYISLAFLLLVVALLAYLIFSTPGTEPPMKGPPAPPMPEKG